MKIGISLFNNQGIEDVQALVGLAEQAEALGFDSVWVHDHVFNVGHVYDRIGGRPYYEPLALLSYVAARTRRVRLGTSVLVLPYHNPIRLAKTAATLDVLSGGRLILGIGVGAIENEMEAMGTPFKQRGAFTDEAIAVMRTLWTEEDPRFDGKFSRFAGMKFSPKPVQKPSIPVVIGGVSPRGDPPRGPARRWLAAAGVLARRLAPGHRLAARAGAGLRSGCRQDSGRHLDDAGRAHAWALRARE